MRILVAEDTAFWRMQIGEVLEGLGHEVLWASDGAEAWARLAENDEVDLLVTDWEMPRMSGIDLCRRLRAESRETYLPIILLTSREGKKDLAQGLNAGADAFVTKPVNDAELKAQLGVAERILKLEADLATKVRDLTAATRRIDRDQRAAAAVQRSLLPGRAPEIPGVDFGWVYESCELVGGDMFNLCRLTDELVGMYILDVSGHGTPAALLSVGLSHVLTPFPEQGGILKRRPDSGSRDGVIPPSEVAAELNRRYPLMEKSRQYLTFLYGILDLGRLTFRYARAGHPGPIQVTASGARSHDGGGGIPIGISEDARYRNEIIALSPGDRVVFYTDGATEAANDEDEEFGVDRLLACLSEPSEGGIRAQLRRLNAQIQEFTKPGRLRDDVTMVGLGLE